MTGRAETIARQVREANSRRWVKLKNAATSKGLEIRTGGRQQWGTQMHFSVWRDGVMRAACRTMGDVESFVRGW